VQNYVVPPPTETSLFPSDSTKRSGRLTVHPAIAATAFTATSYTFIVSGSFGARWNVFPSAVGFYSVGSEPGAPGGGSTAINAAFSSWNGEANSNINYSYVGADASGTHNGGIGTADNQNSIAFERDLSGYGVGAFTCSGNSYSGTLGLGGITSASGSHAGPNGETFFTTHEGDVEMNKGIANCTLLFNNGDFNSAVTHEVGHTLGFRHSDQTRADNPSIACSSDASLECSTTAIMKSFIPNGLNAALQAWDQHAAAAVYPGSGGTIPAAPAAVVATAVNSTTVSVSWNASSGATSYDIYRQGPGTGSGFVGSSSTTSFTDSTAAPNSAYLYRVRAKNAAGSSGDSAADLATTVIFTDDPLVPRSTVVKAVHLNELRTAINAVRALAGQSAAPFTDTVSRGVVVKAIHITQLRTYLDQAMTVLGFGTGGYTDATLTRVVIKAVHFQEIRDRVK
jgi:hypothetical protein